MRIISCKACFAAAFASLLASTTFANEVNGAKHDHGHHLKSQQPFGIAGDRRDVRRTIEVRMVDEMRFVPAKIDIREGETVRFVISNDGKLMHELVLGTRKDLEAHAAMDSTAPMRRASNAGC